MPINTQICIQTDIQIHTGAQIDIGTHIQTLTCIETHTKTHRHTQTYTHELWSLEKIHWLESPQEEMPGNVWVFLGWFQSSSFKEYKQPSFLERTLPPLPRSLWLP